MIEKLPSGVNAIVTTTINFPTEATYKFAAITRKGKWHLIIVGDQKTPSAAYEKLVHSEKTLHNNSNVTYLPPSKQIELYTDLSNVIGWNTIQRRNIGLLHAWKLGAEVIATVDDDNIPYDNWGDNVLVGQHAPVHIYKNRITPYFDPFSVTNHKDLWHRGYPIERLETKNSIDLLGVKLRKVLIQADFWDGDPDIDAICRLTKKPLVKFDEFDTFGCIDPAPFNSQNTFIHRCVFPQYSVWPGIGRMDDIWASYYVGRTFRDNIVYSKASVYQERNPQDLVRNLENECIGYRYTKAFIDSECDIDSDFVPEVTRNFIHVWEKQFK